MRLKQHNPYRVKFQAKSRFRKQKTLKFFHQPDYRRSAFTYELFYGRLDAFQSPGFKLHLNQTMKSILAWTEEETAIMMRKYVASQNRQRRKHALMPPSRVPPIGVMLGQFFLGKLFCSKGGVSICKNLRCKTNSELKFEKREHLLSKEILGQILLQILSKMSSFFFFFFFFFLLG